MEFEEEKDVSVAVPDSVLLKIFHFLDLKTLRQAGSVSEQWFRVSGDDHLWKQFFCRDFGIPIAKAESSKPRDAFWLDEYRRLHSESPRFCSQTIKHHKDEVMRVAFSKNSEFMASVSKDLKVCVWKFDRKRLEFTLFAEASTEELTWNYPRFVQFNDKNTHLIVTGQGALTQKNGAVYWIDHGSRKLSICLSFLSEPSLMCGQWLTENSIISTYISAPYINNRLTVRLSFLDHHTTSPKSLFYIQFGRGYNKMPHFLLVSRCIPESLNPPGDYKIGDRLLLYSISCADEANNGGNYVGVHLMRQSDVDAIVDEQQPANQIQERAPIAKIDCGGFIVGMKLAADERFLVVNVRPRKEDNIAEAPEDGMSEDMDPSWDPKVETKIIDLKTLTLLPNRYLGSLNPTGSIWYKYPDASNGFVASGSGDKFAYLWSRDYGCLLSKLEHDAGGIDCAVFDPNDQEILVSVSDDKSMKVWVSQNKIRKKLDTFTR